MIDREKVVQGLGCHKSRSIPACYDCPYNMFNGRCVDKLIDDVLDLIKIDKEVSHETGSVQGL